LNRRTSLPRSIAKLSTSLDRRLKAYCLAAGAAGVSVLALADPLAEARIIYTPAYGHLPFERWMPVDINHDGVPDVSLLLSSSVYKVVDRAVVAQAAVGGAVIGYAGQFNGYASALAPGRPIGSKEAFLGGAAFLCRTEISHYVHSFTFSAGPWREAKDRYLGVEFSIDGSIHYGWIRMSVNRSHKLEAIVTGYAYETIANLPIRAGQTSDENEQEDSVKLEPAPVMSPPYLPVTNVFPSATRPMSLGMLALGADGPIF
jgi:hypothetical protein